MPIAPSNPQSVAGQIGQLTQASTTQKNFREMVGFCAQWNPDCPVTVLEAFIQNAYRKVIDRRLWYGMLVRGEVTVPDLYATGTVVATNGSTTVTGTGTAWDTTFEGRQFRVGLTLGKYYTIKTVNSATSLELDLPWGSATQNGVGYQIFQAIVSFGANIKMLRSVINTRLNRKMLVNIPMDVIEAQDPQRSRSSFPYLVAQHPPSSAGEPLFEIYPRPTAQQAFPFLAYIQPPDLVEDDDFPIAFVRSDILEMSGIANALLFRGTNSKYFNPQVAELKMKEFETELMRMELNDNNLYQSSLIWDYENFPAIGCDYAQDHE